MLTSVPENPNDVASRIQAVIDANQEARRAMRASEVVLKRALRSLERTGSVPETLKGMPAVVDRPSVKEPLEKYVESRHELRLAVIARCLDEGMSIGEVGRQYGFSRQLASRYAKEVRERTQAETRSEP